MPNLENQVLPETVTIFVGDASAKIKIKAISVSGNQTDFVIKPEGILTVHGARSR